MGREFELKYALTEEAFAAVRQRYAPFTPITMETVYYDTPSGALGKNRWTLRRRYENGVSICAMKTGAVNGERGEWEVACDSVQEAVEPLVAIGAPGALTAMAAEGLVPTCGARFTRLAAPVRIGGSMAELALDQGVVMGGSREAPLFELEIELKEGSEEDLLALGAELEKTYGIVTEHRSKFARALALAAEA